MLERHYGTSITTAGALITAGAIAADIGIANESGSRGCGSWYEECRPARCQKQIAAMATDLSGASSGGVVAVGNQIVAGRTDWSHWANTLADTLPGGAAQSLVRTMQTGQLDAVRENLSGKQQATIEYSVGALAGGAISGKAGSVGGQRGWAVQAEEARRTESLRVRCRRAGSAREMTRTKEVVLLRNVVEFRFNV